MEVALKEVQEVSQEEAGSEEGGSESGPGSGFEGSPARGPEKGPGPQGIPQVGPAALKKTQEQAHAQDELC